MTLLTASIFAHDDGAWRGRVDAALQGGADAIELRLDEYDGNPAEVADFVAKHKDKSWILTCRAADEGGRFDGDTTDRVSRLIEASRGHEGYVDFEWSHWRRSANIRQKVLLAASSPGDADHRLILSAHDFDRVPADLAERARAMIADRHASVVKIAARARDICDNFAVLDLLREANQPMIALCMGEAGMMSRVLAGKFGAFATYCATEGGSATAPGQLTLAEMRRVYRVHQIGPATRVFGVIGDPVRQSLGPTLHNGWFAALGIDAVYLPLLVSSSPGVLARFLDGCSARSWLDVQGLSVTVPHKVGAMAWVGDGADESSRAIGAVNTLVRGQNGWTGHNTDAAAAVDSLVAALGIARDDLEGVPIDVLGAGGSARAVVAALAGCGAKTTIYNRTPERADALAARFDVVAQPWSELENRQGKIVINCTKVGMAPLDDATPISADNLSGCECAFDLIYNPRETRFLREARSAGITAINGLDMFVRQAAMQFALWTGIAPDVDEGRRMVENASNALPHVGDEDET